MFVQVFEVQGAFAGVLVDRFGGLGDHRSRPPPEF
jgi:hypothetical protein